MDISANNKLINYQCDQALLEFTLKLSPEERIDYHQSVLEFALELKEAGENARSQENPRKTPGK